MAFKASHLFFCIFLFSILLSLLSRANSSPFEYLKNLQGSHKSENVKGLHQVKTYLEKFGYLNYQNARNQAHANDDNFDDLLESAIKTYQQNYGLKVTGTLDAETVSKMMEPRCGVPDIINGTNWMQRGRKRHLLGHGAIHSVSHYSFFSGNPRWPLSQTTLTWAFQPGSRPDAVSSAGQAFNNWQSATRFSFSQTSNYATSNLKLSFQRLDHGDGAPFDGPGGILAHAYAPTDGRCHYDADEQWVVGAVPGGFDLGTLSLHEIGHLLGLGHSSVPAAIMYPSIAPGTTKGLNADDIAGIRALYT